MFLTDEYEKLVHLIARAIAKAHGSETPHIFAATVVEHAKALSASDEAATAEPAPAEPAAEHPTELPPGDAVQPAPEAQ